MVKEKLRAGYQFEEAVFRFAKSLDSNAQVLFNHSVPDRAQESHVNVMYGSMPNSAAIGPYRFW